MGLMVVIESDENDMIWLMMNGCDEDFCEREFFSEMKVFKMKWEMKSEMENWISSKIMWLLGLWFKSSSNCDLNHEFFILVKKTFWFESSANPDSNQIEQPQNATPFILVIQIKLKCWLESRSEFLKNFKEDFNAWKFYFNEMQIFLMMILMINNFVVNF